MKRGSASELRPCLGQGAYLGEEAVSADSGRAGEVAARAVRVRSLALLNTRGEISGRGWSTMNRGCERFLLC